MKAIIRPFNKETDTGLILDTWPKCAYHSAARAIDDEKQDWFGEIFFHVKIKLANAHVLIACSDEEPNLILGYAVVEHECLEFIWVKERYREKGIGCLLLTRLPIKYFNPKCLTHDGVRLINNLNLKERIRETQGPGASTSGA